MDDQEVQRKIIVTESGEQIPTEAPAGIVVSVILSDDVVKEEIRLDVTDEEFVTMQKQAVRNRIPRAMLLKKKC